MFLPENTKAMDSKRMIFESLRGATVSAFANTEFLVKSYLIAISDRSDFLMSDGYSHKVEALFKNFRSSFEDDKFSNEFRGLIGDLVDVFESVIDDRNQFVHGRSRLLSDGETVEMLRYLPSRENNYQVIRSTYELASLENRVKFFDHICQNLIDIILKLDNSFDLGIRAKI